MHIEAAKMLSFTEEEFMKALDWGNHWLHKNNFRLEYELDGTVFWHHIGMLVNSYYLYMPVNWSCWFCLCLNCLTPVSLRACVALSHEIQTSTEVSGQTVHSGMSGKAETVQGIFQHVNFVISLLCFSILNWTLSKVIFCPEKSRFSLRKFLVGTEINYPGIQLRRKCHVLFKTRGWKIGLVCSL